MNFWPEFLSFGLWGKTDKPGEGGDTGNPTNLLDEFPTDEQTDSHQDKPENSNGIKDPSLNNKNTLNTKMDATDRPHNPVLETFEKAKQVLLPSKDFESKLYGDLSEPPPPNLYDMVTKLQRTTEDLVKKYKASETELLALKGKANSDLNDVNIVSYVAIPIFPDVPLRGIIEFNDVRVVEYYFGRVVFKGDKKETCDIHEFLQSMVIAQERAQLSEPDFWKMFLTRLASHALKVATRKKDLPIVIVFNQLFNTFNKYISPIQAQALLREYLMPINFGISHLCSELEHISSIAARGGENENDLLISINMIAGLQNGLPSLVYSYLDDKLNDIRRKHGKHPDLDQIISCLQTHEGPLDNLLALSAGSFKFAESREVFSITLKENYRRSALKRSNKKFMGKTVHAISTDIVDSDRFTDVTDETDEATLTDAQVLTTTVDAIKKAGPTKNLGKFQNFKKGKKKVCAMCGSWNHATSQCCFSIFDDGGKVYNGPPSPVHCNICEEKLNKTNMYHPVKYCPLREKAIELYKTGEVSPRGIFKSYLDRIKKESEMKTKN